MNDTIKINDIIKKLFGLEQKELVFLLFFLAIFVFCIYSLIVILIEEKNLFKQLKKYKIIEKHKQEIFLILILPIIFLILVCFGLIDFNSWLGFFGGYFGVLGAIGAIYLQSYEEKRIKIKNIKLYINFILDCNLKNFYSNIESEIISLFIINTNITTIYHQHNYFINFSEKEIQNNISIYIELGIIKNIYRIFNLINRFSDHYNYYFENSNCFHNEIASLKKTLNFNNENLREKFDIIYSIVNTLVNINVQYNSLPFGHSCLLFLPHLNKELKNNYDNLKKFSSYYEYLKIDNVFFTLDKLTLKISSSENDITLDSNIILCLFEGYKESLENLFLFLKDYRLLNPEKLKKFELMLFSLNITYDTFYSLKEKIEELKKFL